MWVFNAYETASKPPKTFDVEDFLSSLFRPQDAFVHAASLNQLEVVRRWISKSHNINELDKEGNLALCTAAQNRCMEVMLLLLESGVDTNAQQADGKTALHIACTWGRFDAAALLLQHGASATLRDRDGQVPLHGACKNGHDRIVQLLLEANVDPFIADDCGATPFDLARDWQRLDILRILDEYRRTTFTPAMRQRVVFVTKHLSAPAPAMPVAMQGDKLWKSTKLVACRLIELPLTSVAGVKQQGCPTVGPSRRRLVDHAEYIATATPDTFVSDIDGLVAASGSDHAAHGCRVGLRDASCPVAGVGHSFECKYPNRPPEPLSTHSIIHAMWKLLTLAVPFHQDKMRMLFVLSQKLLRWFVAERRELERLNQTLQEELLEALRASDNEAPANGDVARRDDDRSASPPPTVCSQEAETQTEEVDTNYPSDSPSTQVEAASELVEVSVQTESEVAQGIASSQTQEPQTHQEAEHVAMCIQTEAEPVESKFSDSQATQTVTDQKETRVQTEIANNEASVQTDAASPGVDGGIQTEETRVDTMDSSNQTDSSAELVETDSQTDAAPASIEDGVQTETSSEPVECGVQVLIRAEFAECSMQTQTVECMDCETQATTEPPSTTDQAVCTQNLIICAGSSAGTEPIIPVLKSEQEAQTEIEVAVVKPPLETYFQVQRSVMMLQRIVRGFVTRRRFFRMLTELVNAK